MSFLEYPVRSAREAPPLLTSAPLLSSMSRMTHWLIVGASRGLGLALVQEILGRGGRVSALVRSPTPRLAELARGAAARLQLLTADVRSEHELGQAARSLSGNRPVDVFVYNAAIHLERQRPDLLTADPEQLLATLDVNAVGAARAVKQFRPTLRPGALMAMISSEAGSISDAGRANEYGYCMSKAALNMLTKLLHNREAALGEGVQVLALHPGWVRTEMGGPNADLAPATAAAALVSTLEQRLQHPGPLFVDRFGQAMNW